MSECPDYAALLAGHTDIIAMINAGEGGLPALNRLLGLAQRALGAAGLAFVERSRQTGRVIATVGAADWTLGRPVSVTHPASGGGPTDEATREFFADELFDERPEGPRDSRRHRVVVARAAVGDLIVGALHVYYSTSDSLAPEVHTVAAYLATCIAHMYGDQNGLPVHGDGPVVAALTDGLAIIDQDGRVRLWNPAAERITGRPAAEALNHALPFPVPSPGETIDHCLPEGRWVRITAGELPGQADSRVVTFQDVTDQRHRDQERDLFFAVTSHELRTPVTVIKGYADTLSEHWDALPESERRRAARIIGHRASELARLVDRLLAAASDLGASGGAPAPFDVLDALRDAVQLLPTDLRRRLVLRLPVHLPKALGERGTLATVLTELATNAQKYSPEDTPIELTAESDDQTVVFRVSDRGIGIRPEHVERVFDRFWQGESGDRRRPGAGLGLYLVRRIVERQNGWVSVRPREGGGTVAEVRLPRG